MREILFRGKRIYNGEWVEGCLVVKNDPVLEISYCFILAQGRGDSFVTWHKVDSATVGQYTGLTDKHGKRIWEGDVVRITIPVKDAKPITQISPVYYSNGCFCVNWCGGYPEHHRTRLDDFCYSVAFEVIGNCHDNPELLKEA